MKHIKALSGNNSSGPITAILCTPAPECEEQFRGMLTFNPFFPWLELLLLGGKKAVISGTLSAKGR